MYKGYTDKQIEDMGNGCGASSGIIKFIRPPHGKFFKEACNKHDCDYMIGGREVDRTIADLSLKQRMMRKINKTGKDALIKELYTDQCGIPNWLIKLLPRVVIIQVFKAWAYAYWEALILFGGLAFNYTKKA